MTNIHFRPWVGEKYFSEGFGGKRILVLGESHYCPLELAESGRCYPCCRDELMDERCFSQTEGVISDIVYAYNGEPYMQTFLCFERAVMGRPMSQEEREDFWQRVVFYNYVQYAVKASRTAPERELFVKSEPAFKELLEQYMPDYIIVWGVRLYNNMADWGGVASKLYINDSDFTDIWTYTISGKDIPALKVHHPSFPTGKCWEYWHLFYEKFLNGVNNQ